MLFEFGPNSGSPRINFGAILFGRGLDLLRLRINFDVLGGCQWWGRNDLGSGSYGSYIHIERDLDIDMLMWTRHLLDGCA